MADIRQQRPPRRERGKETARQRRKRVRHDAVLERERRALELFIRGETYMAIAMDLDVSYSTAWEYVHRGLKRRADQDGEIATKARAMLQLQLEALMSTWMPRALGVDQDTGLIDRSGADPRAAQLMETYIRRYAEITGALAPVKIEGDVSVYPQDPEAAIELVMAGLARVAEKNVTIDGHLANVGHTQHELTGGIRDDDALPPPLPFEQEAA